MTTFKIIVNNEEFELPPNAVQTLDLSAIDGTTYHMLHDGRSYDVTVRHADYSNKTLSLSVNGNTYAVAIEDQYDQQVNAMGLLSVSSHKLNAVHAPMPGLIVDIMVKKGQEVVTGTPLIVLSAMKMENIILSQGDGVVKTVVVKKDDAVEKGQLLIEME